MRFSVLSGNDWISQPGTIIVTALTTARLFPQALLAGWAEHGYFNFGKALLSETNMIDNHWRCAYYLYKSGKQNKINFFDYRFQFLRMK
jgi:hypothetical protein